MTIFTFTGTGNSLYVARELASRLDDAEILPLISLMKEKTVVRDSDAVGFVFPVHALTIPVVLRLFLKRLELPRCRYAFAVASREGTFFRGFGDLDRLLRRAAGRKLDAHFLLEMPNNDPRGETYSPASKEDISALKDRLVPALNHIAEVVGAQQVEREEDRRWTIGFPHGRLVNWFLEKMIIAGMRSSPLLGGVQYFSVDEKCIGCGVCARICPSDKITMIGGGPDWDKKTLCYMCYACVNFCPVKAVQVDSIPGVVSHTRNNGRYSHPFATVKNLVAQKTGDPAFAEESS